MKKFVAVFARTALLLTLLGVGSSVGATMALDLTLNVAYPSPPPRTPGATFGPYSDDGRTLASGRTTTSTEGQTSLLQYILASHYELDEGEFVTGYHGQTTDKYVKMFQCQYVRDERNNPLCSGDWEMTGYGFVGQKTRTALMKYARENQLLNNSNIGQVISPTAGEQVAGGVTYAIRWSSTALGVNPIVDLYKNGRKSLSLSESNGSWSFVNQRGQNGQSLLIAFSVFTEGAFAGNDYKIRVTKRGDEGTFIESGAFTLVTETPPITPSVRLRTPAASFTLTYNQETVFEWDSNFPTSLATYELQYRPNSVSWGSNPNVLTTRTVATSGAWEAGYNRSAGVFTPQTTTIATGSYVIRACAKNSSQTYCSQDRSFTVSDGSQSQPPAYPQLTVTMTQARGSDNPVDQVALLQSILISALNLPTNKFYAEGVGVYGNETKNAVAAFAAAHKAEIIGVSAGCADLTDADLALGNAAICTRLVLNNLNQSEYRVRFADAGPLTATIRSAGGVNLAWTKLSAVSGYDSFRSPAPITDEQMTNNANLPLPNCSSTQNVLCRLPSGILAYDPNNIANWVGVDANTGNGQTYYYRVQGFKQTGDFAHTQNVGPVSIGQGSPVLVSLSLANGSNPSSASDGTNIYGKGQVVLSWDRDLSSASHKIVRKLIQNGSFSAQELTVSQMCLSWNSLACKIQVNDYTPRTTRDPSVLPGRTYSYVIVNSDTGNVASSPVTITVPALGTSENDSARLSATITPSSTASGSSVSALSDQNLETLWYANDQVSGANNTASLTIDLGSLKIVRRVRWIGAEGMPYPAHSPSKYMIECSSDGAVWRYSLGSGIDFNTNVISGVGTPVTIGDIGGGICTSRYLRFTAKQVNDGTGWSLGFKEFWVEGDSGESSIASTPTITATTPAPTASISNAGGTNTTVSFSLANLAQGQYVRWWTAPGQPTAVPTASPTGAEYQATLSSDRLATTITFATGFMTPGVHTLYAEIMSNTASPLSPRVFATWMFTVAAPNADLTCTPDGNLCFNRTTRLLSWKDTSGKTVKYWQIRRSPEAAEPAGYISNCTPSGIWDSIVDSNWTTSCNATPKGSITSYTLPASTDSYFYRVNAVYNNGDWVADTTSARSGWLTVPASGSSYNSRSSQLASLLDAINRLLLELKNVRE
ncbi:MAG: discoidin domain-containing protein [Candidatus Vogelbacteria bacterium]|nr:discoidin domain-containing protein [Candidatus Vogelbacteria bacterium]